MFPLLSALSLAVPGHASPQSDPALFFADCVGRSTAVVYHEQINASGPTDQSRARRAQFADLLSAVAPASGPEFDVLWNQRKRSQDAQERLLIQGAYHVDPDKAARAAAEAERKLALCDAALLG